MILFNAIILICKSSEVATPLWNFLPNEFHRHLNLQFPLTSWTTLFFLFSSSVYEMLRWFENDSCNSSASTRITILSVSKKTFLNQLFKNSTKGERAFYKQFTYLGVYTLELVTGWMYLERRLENLTLTNIINMSQNNKWSLQKFILKCQFWK